MMQLHCPWCGLRSESEFDCGGPTGIVRPPLDCSDEVWTEYLFFRDNPKGRHDERWRHTFGCGQWFVVRRDTLTHEVAGSWRFGEEPPR